MAPEQNDTTQDSLNGRWLSEEEVSEHPPFPENPTVGETPSYISDRVVESLKIFRNELGTGVNVLYYPCSGSDLSLATAFFKDSALVIHSDIEDGPVKILRENGLIARKEDATIYIPPESIDAVFMLNPTISPDHPASIIRPEGFFISNNYHRTADRLRELENFEFIGAIVDDPASGLEEDEIPLKLDRDDLDLFWQEIDTEQDFEHAPFSWTAADYSEIQPIVRRIFGEAIGVLEGYLKLREMVERRVDGMGILEIEGKEELINMHLPRKKGTADDLFIFRKKTTD